MSELENKISAQARKIIQEFNLIEEGDNIMVAVSGGKDSLALLHTLTVIQKTDRVKFLLTAVHLNQGQPNFDLEGVKKNISKLGYEPVIINRPTYKIVKSLVREGQAACFMCSRLRRGMIYNFAFENGFNKIALGHHREDMLETFLMNLFRTGQIKTLPPKLRSDDKRNTIIRPLLYTAERDLAELVKELGIDPVPCGTCSAQPDLERKKMKQLLAELEKEYPALRDKMLSSMKNVRPEKLFDKNLLPPLP